MKINSSYYLISSIFRRLSQKRKRELFLVIFLSLLSSFAELLSIATLIPFISFFLNPDTYFFNKIFKNFFLLFSINSKEEILTLISFLFILLILLSSLIKIKFIKLSNELSEDITSDFRIKIFNFLISQEYSYYSKYGSSEIMSNLSQKTNTFSTIIFSSINILNSFLLSLAILFVLVINEPIFTPAIISLVVIFFLIIFNIKSKKVLESGKNINVNQNKFIDIFDNSVGYLKEIIIYDLKIFFSNSLSSISKQNSKQIAKIRSTGMLPKIYLEAFFIIISVMLIYFLNYSNRTLMENVGYLAILAYGIQKTLPQINTIYNLSINFKSVVPIVQSFLNILDSGKKNFEIIKDQDYKKVTFNNNITFENVNYKYEEATENLFKNFNLKINKGEKIAIKGQTGSGKSTLINILTGLINPISGNIFVDGVKIEDTNKNGWQKNIAIVPQSIYLDDTSILENITLGLDQNNISLDKLKSVIKTSQLENFIEKLPNKIYENVGERGVRISGGQRQRIGIARALYRNSNILVLDEPTSSLDSKTEKNFFESLINTERDKTIIIIIHNDNLLSYFDKIIDLDKFNH